MNGEHYHDPTADGAIGKIAVADRSKAADLIRCLRFIIRESGFELKAAELRSKRTGKVYKAV